MFFSISKIQNNSFPNHIRSGNLFIDFDDGWTVNKTSITKGYNGKGCEILFDSIVTIMPNGRQSFPIFIDETNFIISNLFFQTTIFVGKVIIVDDTIIKIDAPTPQFKELELSDSEIIDQIDQTITNNILNFNSNKPFKIFLTGGVDTALISAYVLKHKLPYELVRSEHIDLDYFLCWNRKKLKNFWAYKSIHHWTTSSVLLSGANGDEMMIRNPYDAFNIMKFYGEDLVDECRSNNYYHSKHFLKDKHIHGYRELTSAYNTEYELKQSIYSRNNFDFQHWHLGNTLTFAPLDDLTINELTLNLSFNTLKTQMLDASISKQLIERTYPSIMQYVSPLKNTENFIDLALLYSGQTTL